MNFIETQQRDARKQWFEKIVDKGGAGLDDLTKQTITNTLNHILESGLLEEKEIEYVPTNAGHDVVNERDFGHNTLARAIKAHLDELIKSNSI